MTTGVFAASAASVYVEYGYESTFGGGASGILLFGKEVKGTGLEVKNNQMPLGQLYTTEIESFAYGKLEGKISVEYVLSNPWFFESILSDSVSASAAGALFTHTWESDPATNATVRDLNTMALRIGYDVNADFLRDPVGAVCNSLSFKMALGETIKITQEIIWGEETNTETFLAPTGVPLAGESPYTFVNASITSPLTGSTLATIQLFDLNLNTNAELLFEFGSELSVDAWRKILEMTGKVTVTVKDSAFLKEVLNRAESANDMVVTISNGAAGDALREIVMTFTGVSFSSHGNTGIEPGELILENVDFQARSVTVVATNEATALP